MNEYINILIASDINYSPYYGVLLYSLLINNKECSFHVYWLTDNSISLQIKQQFYSLIKENNSILTILEVDREPLKEFPQISHINLASYYNLQASVLLPEEVHKIIYLDGDMIVNGDIRPLWNINLEGYACAQVCNCTFYDDSYYTRLEYDKKWGYYNNGTTVYNIDYLRDMDFSRKALEAISKRPKRYKWMDQDIANELLHDKIISLPLKYNFQTLFFYSDKWEHYSDSFRQKIFEAAEDPVIVHYCGHIKPWNMEYIYMPYSTIWNEYCKISPWNDIKERKPFIKYLKQKINCYFFRYRLIKRRNSLYTVESLKYS